MGPHGYAKNGTARDRQEARLKGELAQEFPDWDIHDVFGGFQAVSKGTPVLRSATLDGLMGKLAQQRDQAP